jgi:fused signal recognition particle receptor
MSFFEKLKRGLQKTKNAIFKPFSDLFKSLRKVDEDLMEELEEILICADVGANTTEMILDELREQIKENKIKDSDDVKIALKDIMLEMIGEG